VLPWGSQVKLKVALFPPVVVLELPSGGTVAIFIFGLSNN
jgi:hypothetical protein